MIFSHVLYQLSYLGADLAESEDQGERGGYRGSFLPCPGTGPAAHSERQAAAADSAGPDSPEFPQVFGAWGPPPPSGPRSGLKNFFEKLFDPQEPRRPRRVIQSLPSTPVRRI